MDKTNFLHELRTMYDELIKMDDIEYLHEENKRKFIMDNCRSKKIKGVNEHLEFHRVACLQDIAKGIEEMVVYERKKTLSNGSNLLGESPMLIKMSSKESPTVLEVNLSEQYQKHQAAKQQRRSKPIKSTITINSERMPVNRMSK